MHDDRTQDDRTGQIAVIFVSQRTRNDAEGYGEASVYMEQLAAAQPGYRGIEAARGTDGLGITVSYWADEASASSWRNHPDHRRIQTGGRERWYDAYEVAVARVERGYRWSRG